MKPFACTYVCRGVLLTLCVALMAGIPLPADARESVGLVLSGGGAKGIAHIGVIKALEDNDIPIDYVAGTSMGAVVGGLYSCGYSPERMMDLIRSKGFKDWSTGTVDESLVWYYSIPEPSPRLMEIHLNLKDSVRLGSSVMPSSLINPMPMTFAFMELFSQYTAQCDRDFNRLFVPFRCVTSDVYHKRKIVCSHGSVADAIRASMSFPMVYKPIKMDGVLVFDGGIYDNFPVDVMREDFHPDFMIGVSVSGPDGPPEPNNLYSQVEDMIIQNNDYSLPAKEGVKIQVPVLNFGVLDFDKAQQIYDIGYKTGLSMVDSIRSRLAARRSPEEVAARREAFNAKTPVLMFDSVTVHGPKPGQADYIRYLFTKGSDRPFDVERAKGSYYQLIGSNKIADIFLQADYQKPTDMFGLDIDATVKDRWSLGMGGWITSSVNSMLYISAGYRTLSHNSLDIDLSGWIGQSYWAGWLNARMHMRTPAPSLIELQGVMSRRKLYDNGVWFYQGDGNQYCAHTEDFLRLKYVMATNVRGKAWVDLGYCHFKNNYYRSYDSDALNYSKDRSIHNMGALGVGYEHLTLNNRMYPSAGRKLRITAQASLMDTKFYLHGEKDQLTRIGWHPRGDLKVEWKQYFPLVRNFSLGVSAEGALTLLKLEDNYSDAVLMAPAFGPTPAMQESLNEEFRAYDYVALGVSPVWMPLSRLQVRGDFYAYVPVRDIAPKGTFGCCYSGWLKRAEFMGELAVVYNFPFASLSVYGDYMTTQTHSWSVGIAFGLYFLAPKF